MKDNENKEYELDQNDYSSDNREPSSDYDFDWSYMKENLLNKMSGIKKKKQSEEDIMNEDAPVWDNASNVKFTYNEEEYEDVETSGIMTVIKNAMSILFRPFRYFPEVIGCKLILIGREEIEIFLKWCMIAGYAYMISSLILSFIYYGRIYYFGGIGCLYVTILVVLILSGLYFWFKTADLPIFDYDLNYDKDSEVLDITVSKSIMDTVNDKMGTVGPNTIRTYTDEELLNNEVERIMSSDNIAEAMANTESELAGIEDEYIANKITEEQGNMIDSLLSDDYSEPVPYTKEEAEEVDNFTLDLSDEESDYLGDVSEMELSDIGNFDLDF